MDVMMLCYPDSDARQSVALENEITSIGRSPDQDIVLGESEVSRRHAVIRREADRYFLIDQGSTHGTFVNRVRVQRTALKPGDILQLGSLNAPILRLQPRDGPHLASPVSTILSSLIQLRPSGEAGRPARELEQLNWLFRAARQLNQGVAIEDIILGLLQLTLELTGLERGFVFLQEDGHMHLARGLSASGAILDEDSTVSRKAMRNAIEKGSRFSISDTRALDPSADWPSLMEKGIRSIYCIPLRRPASARKPGQLLGLLYLDSQLGAGAFSELDHQVLETLATEAAALVDHALLAEEEFHARQAREELQVAADIHRGLMSITMPALDYAVIDARSIPCLAIGGDFYDAVELGDSLCIALADVSGKGVSAAIVAATLQGIIHSQFLAGQSLPRIATVLNHFLCARKVGKYATLVLLRLFRDGNLEYINCGHLRPISIYGDTVSTLDEGNLIVGLIPTAEYTSSTCKLRPGERLLLPTDGLTEAEDPEGRVFGESGLMECALHHRVDQILETVATFHAPNPAADDRTLLEVRYVHDV